MKYAVQLYSLRDLIQGDGEKMLKVLGDVKAAGYDGVEFAGFAGLDAVTLKARLDELGLTCVGAHDSLDDFKPENLEKTIEFHKILGCKQMGIGGANTKTEASFKKVLEILGEANAVAEKQGIKVYFHNHSGEFKRPLFSPEKDTIIKRLTEVCYIQVDTYWSFHAGIDTPAFLKENRDRIVLVHLKDGIDGNPVALGEGQNAQKPIINACEELGIEWAVVENDDPTPDGLSDVTRSIKYLRANF